MSSPLHRSVQYRFSLNLIEKLALVSVRLSHSSDRAYRATAHKGFFFMCTLLLTTALLGVAAIINLAEGDYEAATRIGYSFAALGVSCLIYCRKGYRQILSPLWILNVLSLTFGYWVFRRGSLVGFELAWVMLACAIMPMICNAYMGTAFALLCFATLPFLPRMAPFTGLDLSHADDLPYYSLFGFMVMCLVVVSEVTRYYVLLEAKHSRLEQEQMHQKLTASIQYATYIRERLLKSDEEPESVEQGLYLFEKPKYTISGDFLYKRVVGDNVYVCLADCTGHGVPGAFISAVGIGFLDEALLQRRLSNPAEILAYLRKKFIDKLGGDSEESFYHDNMEVAVFCFDRRKRTVQIASSFISVWVETRAGSWNQIRADRYPLSHHPTEGMHYSCKTFALDDLSRILTYTDGFTDQLSPAGKKLTKSRVLEQLLHAHVRNTEAMHQRLLATFESWRDEGEQTDDVSMLLMDTEELMRNASRLHVSQEEQCGDGLYAVAC